MRGERECQRRSYYRLHSQLGLQTGVSNIVGSSLHCGTVCIAGTGVYLYNPYLMFMLWSMLGHWISLGRLSDQ